MKIESKKIIAYALALSMTSSCFASLFTKYLIDKEIDDPLLLALSEYIEYRNKNQVDKQITQEDLEEFFNSFSNYIGTNTTGNIVADYYVEQNKENNSNFENQQQDIPIVEFNVPYSDNSNSSFSSEDYTIIPNIHYFEPTEIARDSFGGNQIFFELAMYQHNEYTQYTIKNDNIGGIKESIGELFDVDIDESNFQIEAGLLSIGDILNIFRPLYTYELIIDNIVYRGSISDISKMSGIEQNYISDASFYLRYNYDSYNSSVKVRE